MGDVYRATDLRLGREVAVKVLPERMAADPQSLKRFEQESRAVAALAHPNILVLHDVGAAEGVHYAVAELLEGETLRDRLSHGPLPWHKAVEIGAAVAEGLAAAHSKDIFHRDIKPANIFLTADGRVKILDFGLARFEPKAAERDATVTLAATQPGIVMGTVGYMSPEQVRGEIAGAASDIFSLGIVLYEMVTARRPFGGNSTPEVMSAILREDPTPLAEWGGQAPADLQRIIDRCLHKQSGQRFHSAHDLAFALRSLTTSTAAPAPAARARHQAIPLRTAALAALVLAIAVVGFFFWRSKSGGQTIDSLAVLPFTIASTAPDAAYLSDGITESLIASLSQLPHLKVMSRSAVFRYQGKNADPHTVGRELGVRAVLTGRIVQHASDLSVSAELVNVDANRALWGEQYTNLQTNDTLAVQKDITRQIVDKLKLRLDSRQTAQIAQHQTSNSEAYQLYLKGRYYAGKFDPASLARGRDLLRQAIAADPGYALAYDGLAYYYELVTDWFEPATDVGPKALEAARKALEIAPDLVEAHVELAAGHLFYDYDWAEAERLFKRAIELNPNYAPAHEFHGWFLSQTGKQDEGLAELRKAGQIDPLSSEIAFEDGWFQLYARHYDEALASVAKCLELDPGQWMGFYVRGMIHEYQGKYAEALTDLKKAEEILGANPAVPLADEVRVYALSGRRAEARQSLDRLLALAANHVQVSKYSIAAAYSGLGDKDEVFKNLNLAYDEHSFMLGFLKIDPAFDSVRTDPRFQQLLAKLKFP